MVVYFRPNLTIIKSCWEEDFNREKSAKTVRSRTTWICCGNQQLVLVGREPWSSCYGRWLMIKRSSVWILALYTRWTWHFFTLICCKIVLMFVWKDPFKNTFSSEALFARKKAFNFAIKWHLRYKLYITFGFNAQLQECLPLLSLFFLKRMYMLLTSTLQQYSYNELQSMLPSLKTTIFHLFKPLNMACLLVESENTHHWGKYHCTALTNK